MSIMRSITSGLVLCSLVSGASIGNKKQEKRWNVSAEWTLEETWSGSNFFDHWNFITTPDPTEGIVDYVSEDEAWNNSLIAVDWRGHAIMRVETTKHVWDKRKSVRLEGKKVFTGGLIIMDAYHMPFGCGTWPAWWSYGPDWPNSGEIDIIEGIHDATYNKVSAHTGTGCTMPQYIDQYQKGKLDIEPDWVPHYDAFNCDAKAGGDKGCGVNDANETESYGNGFNEIGGGVYAVLWTESTLQVFFFPRYAIPKDIQMDNPHPTWWGTPVANYTSPHCSQFDFFKNHVSVFDTTLCGTWAGAPNVWNITTDGQPQPCTNSTGYETCDDYVRHEGQNLWNAYWEVGYVKYFNQTW